MTNLKKAGSALGGGILLGPVGAIAGYALVKKEDKPKIKQKVVNNDHDFKRSYIEIHDYKIDVKSKKTNTWPILFDNIHSISYSEDSNSFEVIRTDESCYHFVNETNDSEFTEKLFDNLQTKFNAYIVKNPVN
ncbi:hypothetical protein [Methanobacterium alcaliphilum]|uniref:hypothetical protein n=1 Tax=Methanobacterium alcaliphilum TaxID=392018 RepID=UPI00200AF96A|nr:hypothetical protein [Methanobacterium alcaliphilum]MCK9151059.1 hypothetical protein [Methanobacterium alcaliphilum]